MGGLYESLPSLLAATVAFAIGTSVVLRDRFRDEFVLFAVFCFNLGLFHLTSFFYELADVPLFRWAAQSISLALPWTADRCFSSLIPSDGAPRRSKLRNFMLLVLVGAHAVALFILLRDGSLSLDSSSPWRWISLTLNAYVIFGLLLVVLRIWRAGRDAAGTATSARLSYLFYASLIAVVLGSPTQTILGPVVTAVYLYFVAQTLIRERLLELPELITRIATLTFLVLGATALFALLLLWLPAPASGTSRIFLFNVAFGCFAMIVLLDPVRREIESRLESWLFRDRVLLRTMLVQLRYRLLNVIDPDAMVNVVVDGSS